MDEAALAATLRRCVGELPREWPSRRPDNTLQQNFIFAIASLALSTVIPLPKLQVVRACAIVFIAARTAFWLGYRINPLYRAPGMSATAYMNGHDPVCALPYPRDATGRLPTAAQIGKPVYTTLFVQPPSTLSAAPVVPDESGLAM